MEKGINLLISDFKKDLVEVINECKLPIIVVRQVLGELLNEAKNVDNNAIQEELIKYQKALEEKTKGEEKNGK